MPAAVRAAGYLSEEELEDDEGSSVEESEDEAESNAHGSSVAPALTSASATKSESGEGHGVDDAAAESAGAIKNAEATSAPTYDGPANGYPAEKKSGPSGEGSSGVRDRRFLAR